MSRFFATIYNTKTNSQHKIEAPEKEELYKKLGEVLRDRKFYNIEAEIYGVDEKGKEIERFYWKPKMIDLKNYSDIIRKAVKAESENDKNWKWSVKSISKDLIKIRWGYLAEMNGENDSFIIRLYPEHVNDFEEPVTQVLSGRHPNEEEIIFDFVTEDEPDPDDYLNIDTNIKEALPRLIHRIAVYAHNCY